ncbi:MAG: hypothetical protein AAGD07_18840 [Planctomycetota bacterium]
MTETTLHRDLKRHYAPSDAFTEVALGAYRIDVVHGEELIEIQCASLSAIRRKIRVLLEKHPVRVVKPLVRRTQIHRHRTRRGPVVSKRWSPRRGAAWELFEELIYFTGVFPHPNLVLDVPVIDVAEHRCPRRRRRGVDYRVLDSALLSICETREFKTAWDLIGLLPGALPAGVFNTAQIAAASDCPRWVAQRAAYVLRHAGALAPVGRDRNGIRYVVADSNPTSLATRRSA